MSYSSKILQRGRSSFLSAGRNTLISKKRRVMAAEIATGETRFVAGCFSLACLADSTPINATTRCVLYIPFVAT